MRWASIAAKAKAFVNKRGGTEALKQDAEELRRIAKEPGSMGDKAKKAAEALKEPGAARKPEGGEEAGGAGAAERSSPAERAPTAEDRAAARRGGRPAGG